MMIQDNMIAFKIDRKASLTNYEERCVYIKIISARSLANNLKTKIVLSVG